MAKFQLIMVCADEIWTSREPIQYADTIEEATTMASVHINKWHNDYPDAYVMLLPAKAEPRGPYLADFPVFVKDADDEEYWMRMQVGYNMPIFKYFMEQDDVEELIEDYEFEIF